MSRRSPRAVEPFRSVKTIVTVLRTSCDGGSGASDVPQKPHRRNRSGFSSPQFGQICTSGSLRRALGEARRDPEAQALRRAPSGRPPALRNVRSRCCPSRSAIHARIHRDARRRPYATAIREKTEVHRRARIDVHERVSRLRSTPGSLREDVVVRDRDRSHRDLRSRGPKRRTSPRLTSPCSWRSRAARRERHAQHRSRTARRASAHLALVVPRVTAPVTNHVRPRNACPRPRCRRPSKLRSR